jgi:hypothetical protein
MPYCAWAESVKRIACDVHSVWVAYAKKRFGDGITYLTAA